MYRMGFDESASQEQILNARKYNCFRKYRNLIIVGAVLTSIFIIISIILAVTLTKPHELNSLTSKYSSVLTFTTEETSTSTAETSTITEETSTITTDETPTTTYELSTSIEEIISTL